MADELIPYFCKDGIKEEIGEDLKIDGWTVTDPNPKGHQINYLFNNIFKHLNVAINFTKSGVVDGGTY